MRRNTLRHPCRGSGPRAALALAVSLAMFFNAWFAYSAGVLPAPGDVQVNQVSAGDQEEPSIAHDHNGHVFVVWRTSTGTGIDISLRVFDMQGDAISDEVDVEKDLPFGWTSSASVVANTSGVALVIWRDLYASVVRTYFVNGTPLSPSTLVVDGTIDGFPPSLVAAAYGDGFLLGWVDPVDPTHLTLRPIDSGAQWSAPAVVLDNPAGDLNAQGVSLQALVSSADNSVRALVQLDGASLLVSRYDSSFSPLDTMELASTLGSAWAFDAEFDGSGNLRIFWGDGVWSGYWKTYLTTIPPIPGAPSSVVVEDYGGGGSVTVGDVLTADLTADGVVSAGHRFTGAVPGYPCCYYGNGQAFLHVYASTPGPVGTRVPADDDLSLEYYEPAVAAYADGRVFVAYSGGYERSDAGPILPRDGDQGGIFLRRFCPPDDSVCLCADGTGDADLDAIPDECDLCTNVAGERAAASGRMDMREGWSASFLPVNSLRDNRLRLDLDFMLPDGMAFSDVEAVNDGAVVRVESARGEAAVHFSLPPGDVAAGGRWKSRARSLTFKGVAEFNGLRRFRVLDRSRKAPGLVRVRLRARRGLWGVFGPELPAKVVVTLGSSGIGSPLCTELGLPAESCLTEKDGAILRCVTISAEP